MISYTCDLCGRKMIEDESVRYVVKIEVYAAYDPLELSDDDLIEDHRAEMRELIEKMKDADPQELEDQVYHAFRFDLCAECQKKYLQDPLFRKAVRRGLHPTDN
jgi:hypothetical protein